ncbi:hypothetical protein A2955_01140 [Candidatus Woesebacteria bacterium RIFCSPLOWO2_01_FULL_37_19]|uniref:Ig-like domain-containing protein n=2 Tax=Candidatus Woeseibacteriota TaxID=1752722 RepID=A0A1F8B2F4_9BACT|nr:MAG: hypothetical protein A2771_00480 [Candidatus Woesebacteria bacterium RIFCSPHIGHO2_01_FULL_38_26b]OGM58181.1 MAG: hypothetical protein A2955_01140 [Candidatus Woesebacteria bacterium RIFCSPLOWO2_01_FULL_37_19]
MKKVKKLLPSFIFCLVTIISAGPASAQRVEPDFPACSNPSGSLKISYADGQHAIVGETGLRSGSDAVYDLADGNVLQCFCSVDSSGIQTNWWRAGSLTQEEIDTLFNLGWTFVPDGSLWGLTSEAYLAKNSLYACGGGSSSSSSNSSSSTGSVLATAASTQGAVLGLAATGDAIVIFGFALLGLIFLLLGFYLRHKYRE